MMNINKSSTSSLPNNPTTTTSNPFNPNQTLTSGVSGVGQQQQQQQPTTTAAMKTMTTNVNNNNSNLNQQQQQFGPSSFTTITTAASAVSNSAAGMNPQLPFQSQHSIFSPAAAANSGVSVGITGAHVTPLEDSNINSNSGFDFLSMNPFSTPSDPFQIGGGGGSGGLAHTHLGGGISTSTGGTGHPSMMGGGLNPGGSNFNRERRLSSIFDIENSRDSLEGSGAGGGSGGGGIGLFGSNNVFNVNKEDSCFSFGDGAKNDLGDYDHSLFSFMEQRRYSKGDNQAPQKTAMDQFPLPPLSSPLLGNVNNDIGGEYKFPSRDLLDESSKISYVSNAKSSSLTCKSNSTALQQQQQAQNNNSNQRNISFNEIYNPFNYDALNTNNQSTMQKLLNMQQIILNNQDRIQHQQNTNTMMIDPMTSQQNAQQLMQQQSKQQQLGGVDQQQQQQLVWNSIMNAQRTNERFLAENLFTTNNTAQNQMFATNQNPFLNKENALLEKHIPLNTIAVQSHSLHNAPRSGDTTNNIGFMNQVGFQFGTSKSNDSHSQHHHSKIPPQVITGVTNQSNESKSSSTSRNRKKRKSKESSSDKKKKIKSQGHSSESQLSNQEIILASSSQFDFDERSQPKIALHEDGSAGAMLDDDSNNSSDSNQKKFCFRNLIVEKASKKMKFVNSDIKEEGTNNGAWSEREHQAFLRGLKDLGYGKWREIADRYVKTRTRIQVASHSQKYHQRLERHAKKKKKMQKNSSSTAATSAQQQQQDEEMILQHDTIHSDGE